MDDNTNPQLYVVESEAYKRLYTQLLSENISLNPDPDELIGQIMAYVFDHYDEHAYALARDHDLTDSSVEEIGLFIENIQSLRDRLKSQYGIRQLRYQRHQLSQKHAALLIQLQTTVR